MKSFLSYLKITLDLIAYAVLVPLVCQPILFLFLAIPSCIISSLTSKLIHALGMPYLDIPYIVIIAAWLVNLIGYRWLYKRNYFQYQPRWFVHSFVLCHALIWTSHGVLLTFIGSLTTDACYDTPQEKWTRQLALECNLWQEAPLLLIPYAGAVFLAFIVGYSGYFKNLRSSRA